MEKFFNSKECIDLQENTLQLDFNIFDQANSDAANVDETRGIEGTSMTSIEDAKDMDESITRKVISTTHFLVQGMKTCWP